MTESSEQELKDRLSLIETMIAEGRRTTESWGWAFVLWGVAYYVAIFWTSLGRFPWAWPITMVSAVVLTSVLAARRRGNHPGTTRSRAIASIWIAMGATMMVFFPALGFSGRMDQHIMIGVVSAMLATTNAASSMILRWKMQFACALIWWATAVFACFGKSQQLTIAFLAAIFFCQIVFGIYGMIAMRRRDGQGVIYA
jgi:hypothetical protein